MDVIGVEIVAGLEERFMRNHRRSASAAQAWLGLRATVNGLRAAPFMGQQLPKSRIPRSFGGLRNLWRLPLPNGFRAMYTVVGLAPRRVKVRVEWIGDHKEYDELFGYSTS